MKRSFVPLLFVGVVAFLVLPGLMVSAASLQNPQDGARLGPFGTMEADGKTFTFEGKAIGSSIHTCNLRYDAARPGYCNGTLRVERMVNGKVEQRDIIVTAKIAIERDGKKPATLDSFIGGWVRVEYVQQDGLFVATSVVARTKPDSEDR